MARLAVNVDHVATLREARGINEPDPILAAGIAELAGAECIICHLREDRRHINDRDLNLLRRTVKTRLNMEMAAVEEMIEIARDVGPDLITLVPEKREELTTEGGLDVKSNPDHYKRVVERLTEKGIKVRIIGGPGKDDIKDKSHVSGLTKRTVVYDTRKKNDIEFGTEARNRTSNNKDKNKYERSGHAFGNPYIL